MKEKEGGVRNKEAQRDYNRDYREANKGRIAAQRAAARISGKLKKRVRPPEQLRMAAVRAKEWRRANPDRSKSVNEAWHAANPDSARLAKARYREKVRSTPKGRLNSNISRGIVRGLRGGKGGSKTFDILPYSLIDLMIHLGRQFTEGMNWENYGQWHVDHIIPLAAHNYETIEDEDFKRAWALSNLRPLWAEDNLSKRDKLEKPFQPSFSGV